MINGACVRATDGFGAEEPTKEDEPLDLRLCTWYRQKTRKSLLLVFFSLPLSSVIDFYGSEKIISLL